MLVSTLAVMLALGGGPAKSTGPAKSVEDVWRQLPTEGNGCGEALTFDYGAEGGLRNFACRVATLFSYKQLLRLAPMRPFRSGPHHGDTLDLGAATSFGHYDPAFVRWATTALVPATTNPRLREETQGVYDAQARTLARLYFRVWRVIAADPEWLQRERSRYLDAVARGKGAWADEVPTRYEELLAGDDTDWGGDDPNLVRSATMWWLRRSADETAALWFNGLTRLLSTYDAKWLEAERRAKAPAPRTPTRMKAD